MALVSETKNNKGLNKTNVYVSLLNSQAWAAPSWNMTPKQVGPGFLPPGPASKRQSHCVRVRLREGGILAEGAGRAQPLLLKATQGVESITSAPILLFTRESHNCVELQVIWEVWPLSG